MLVPHPPQGNPWGLLVAACEDFSRWLVWKGVVKSADEVLLGTARAPFPDMLQPSLQRPLCPPLLLKHLELT